MTVGVVAKHADWSDTALVQAIATDKSTAAFRELFVRYAPRLKAHFARAGKSGNQAEDLVQDVMLSVWRHAEAYRPELASVSTWVFRIARNRFIDVVRRQRYVELEEGEPLLADDFRVPGPEETVSTQQLSERVEQALTELPVEQAEVVRGSYFQHESASEMASRLNIPVGTVKSRMRAAMQHLHKRLFEGGGR